MSQFTCQNRRGYITGKKSPAAEKIDATTAAALVADGRGWSNNNRTSYYSELTDEQLFDRLTSWSPVVRERAAMELGRRPGNPVPRLLTMLDDSSLHTRYGACQAIIMLKGDNKQHAVAAVPALKKTLSADDLWLRIKAVEALATIGKPAMEVLPDVLKMFAQHDIESDPRGMQQRYLSFALFNGRGGMLSRSLEGVDRELLYTAVRSGLQNDDGRARGAFGSVYKNLTYEEIEPLLPAIYQAVAEPAPSGIMFADGIRLSGLEILARHPHQGRPTPLHLAGRSRSLGLEWQSWPQLKDTPSLWWSSQIGDSQTSRIRKAAPRQAVEARPDERSRYPRHHQRNRSR